MTEPSDAVARVAAMAAEIRGRRAAGLPGMPRPGDPQVTSRLDELAGQIAALEQLTIVLAKSNDPDTRKRVDALYETIEKMVDAAGMRPAPPRHLRVVRDDEAS